MVGLIVLCFMNEVFIVVAQSVAMINLLISFHLYYKRTILLQIQHNTILFSKFLICLLEEYLRVQLCFYYYNSLINDMNRQQENIQQSFQQFYDELGYNQAQLKWSHHPHSLLISGSSDFSTLSKLKNVILSLRKDWGSQRSKGIRVEDGNDYEKRLQLAQSEIQGLLKRKINYSVKDSNGGQRVLDYSTLLNQKENQIVQLQKKIQNLQEKLSRFSAREVELQNHVVKLTEELKRKQDLISLKHQSAVAQVAISTAFRDALNRLKRNVELNRYKLGDTEKLIFQGVVIPEVGNFDIKSDVFSDNTLSVRSRVFQQQTEGQRYKTRLAQFFREFQRLVNQSQGITDFQVQRILQGYLSNMTETKLYQKMQYSIERYRSNQEFKRLQENFAIAAGLFGRFVQQIQRDNLNYKLPGEVENIFALFQQEKVVALQVKSGDIFVSVSSTVSKTVQVPIQDARTKHLLHLLAHQLKRLFLRYPKIQGEIDERLGQFLKQQIIDVMEVDQIQKLIQIVKFVPHIVKVDNVYVQSTQKARKVQFHLRVLIKALLEELQKIRLKTGVILEMDQGVIGMIKAEIMDAVNVDDILKVFRVCPKIVQVEKIVEKIVDRIIEIPKVVTVQKLVQKIVQVQKIREVQKIVHVPVETPLIVQTEVQKLVPYESKIQTIVQVPTIVEKFVQVQRQVPKIVEVQVIKEKIVQVQKEVQVERVVNHIQVEYQQVEIIVQKIVPVEKIIQKIIEVPIFVEKIVERIVQIPKVIQVQKIVQKIVPIIEYRSARQVENHIEVKYQIVDRIVEKIVPIIQIKQRIKEVPQEIQVIKQVNNVITEIKEVEVIREKIVIQQVVKEVPVVETRLVEVIRQVIKEVDRFIQIPIIRQVAVIKQLIVEKPVISRVQSVHIKQVIIRQPFIVKEPTVLQVIKYVNVYVDVPKMVKYIEEKIVEVPTIVDRIKEVKVVVEKVIEKMVQVPKVVEVEKIVQKVVVVPRVVEKVVEVPQIVQKVIEKQVIREVIRQIERIVHVPVIQTQVKQVQVIKNIYIEVQKPVDRIVEKTVQVPKVQQKIITREVLREVPINLIHEVPREIQVQKIVSQAIQILKPIEVQRQIIVPVQIPVPVDRIIQKVVPKQEIIQRIIPVPQIIQRIVPVIQEVTQIKQVEKIVERIVIQKSIQEIEKIVPYIQEVIKEVPTIIEKFIPIETKVQQIVTAQQIIEKVIEKTITIPQIYQVERIKEKLVQVPKIIEIERIIPQIVRVNQYIQKIVEKIIEVPIIIENIKEVIREQQKIVPIKSQTTEILQVQKRVEKLVYAQKLKQVVRNVNYIQKVLQIIDRIQQIPVAVTTVQERLIEVPYILQKIVEKIIIMPQIVEVLKYVHEVCQQQSAGVCVDVEIGTHQARYKQLSKSIEIHLDSVLKQLRYLKSDQITRARIQTIEKFLEELRKFILVPRIVKVVEQKIVEKQVQVDKIVKLPVQDQKSLKMELSLSILAEKLIAQIKRIKQKTGVNIQLDQDIKLIFFADINANVNLDAEMQGRLKNYSNFIQRQFQNLGNWTTDHQLMLNSFLQERFFMAELIQSANFQIEQSKAVSEQRMEGLKRYKGNSNVYSNYLNKISAIIGENRPASQIVNVIREYQQFQSDPKFTKEPTYFLQDANLENERFESVIRQKEAQISLLRDTINQLQQKSQVQSSNQQQQGIIRVLKGQIDNLRRQNSNFLSKQSQSGLTQSYRQQIADLQHRNLELQSEISRLRSQNYNQANEIKLLMHNVSFKREPQANFQEIDIRETDRNRLQQSQSSQGRSLAGSQSRGGAQIGNFTSSVYVGPKPTDSGVYSKPQTAEQLKPIVQSKLSQSGARNIQQTPQVSNFEGTNLVKSGVYTTQAGQYQYPSYQSSLYQSKGKAELSSSNKGEIISQFGQPLYQSGVQRYQGDINNFGIQESENNRGQTTEGRQQTSGVYQLPQSGISSNQSMSRSGIQIPQTTEIIGQGSESSQIGSRQGGENMYGSRQGTARSITPATQSLYYEQQLGQQQQGRTYVSTAGNLYGSQAQQSSTTQQSSLINTPIEGLKYRSPSPKGAKLTESILKQQQSLSKVSAQSPQVFKKQEGGYKYYYRQQKK